MTNKKKLISKKQASIVDVEQAELDGYYNVTYDDGSVKEIELNETQLKDIQDKVLAQVSEDSNSVQRKGSKLSESESSGNQQSTLNPGRSSIVKRKEGKRAWKQYGMLDAESRPGYRRKWVNTDMNGRVEKMKFEGWEPVNQAEIEDLGIIDQKLTDGKVKRREMLLMEMPEELAIERENYFKSLQVDERQQLENHQSLMGNHGGHSVGYASVE